MNPVAGQILLLLGRWAIIPVVVWLTSCSEIPTAEKIPTAAEIRSSWWPLERESDLLAYRILPEGSQESWCVRAPEIERILFLVREENPEMKNVTASVDWSNFFDGIIASTVYGQRYLTGNVFDYMPLMDKTSDIEVMVSEEVWYLVFLSAWGDCPAGCIFAEFFFFTVRGDEVERVEPERAERMHEFVRILGRSGMRSQMHRYRRYREAGPEYGSERML